MLVELRIRDFAIIDDVSLSLSEGFNVLSGETGAGKSIIVGAMGLLLGDRASSDQVRSGADKAVVEATFDASQSRHTLDALREQGIPVDDDFVVLRREIQAGGRGRAWVNGAAVPSSALAACGRQLASIHGQHEAQSLLDADSQRDVLDAFSSATAEAEEVARFHSQLLAATAEIAILVERQKDADKRTDYLKHVVAEISSAKLIEGEEEKLDEEATRLEHAKELIDLATEGLAALNDENRGALQAIRKLRRVLEALRKIDSSAHNLVESLESGDVLLSELASDLSRYSDRIDIDPQRLARVNDRRSAIFRLARKYGGSVSSALAELRNAEDELSELNSSHDRIAELRARRGEVMVARDRAAARLSEKRLSGAARLSKKVTVLLPSLGMPGAKFHVAISPLDEPGLSGAESVDFLVELNVGHDARPLSKTASGGEMSRIMLAIKTVLAKIDKVPSLVFDEVDAGIGGEVALRVGDALRSLARHHQVLVITHLPQIAARAHKHIIVRKSTRGGVASADVTVVEGNERVSEITRMLSGDAGSSTGRAHAVELLHNASE